MSYEYDKPSKIKQYTCLIYCVIFAKLFCIVASGHVNQIGVLLMVFMIQVQFLGHSSVQILF